MLLMLLMLLMMLRLVMLVGLRKCGRLLGAVGLACALFVFQRLILRK
jgi:hypothetical protein